MIHVTLINKQSSLIEWKNTEFNAYIFQVISEITDGEQIYVVGILKHPHLPKFREMHWDMVIIETIVTVM